MMVEIMTSPLGIGYSSKKAAISCIILAFAFSIIAALFTGWTVAR